jgi:putative peptidoglycan lipid II flippase
MASSGKAAFLVAAGIFLSRIAGLVRQRVFAHYFGSSDAADAFGAAFRIPNMLQNLFGEGVLSASFIPVYARLLAEGDEEEAGRLAGAVVALLTLVTGVLVLSGVVATPWLIDLIAPGFEGEKRELTIRLVRVLFPGAGLLALSAWCLGVLNSHRRFFLSYISPVLWNVAMIATLVAFGGLSQYGLAEALAWGSVVGSTLQVALQLPVVLRLERRLRLRLDARSPHVRTVIHNFGPVFVGRGVVQISSYVDTIVASLLPTGAVAAFLYAQMISMLPVSLFGMSISAAELPAMSSATGDEATVAEKLRARLDAGLRRIAFFIVPSAAAFVALGDVAAAAVYQSGDFTHDDAVLVWSILAGAAVGLLAITQARLYSSTYYALRDTRTPLKYAAVHVSISGALGYVLAVYGPGWLGVAPIWGVAGLQVAAGIGGLVEFKLLRHTLNRRIGKTGLPASLLAKLWGAAALGAAAGWGVKLALPSLHPIPLAALVFGAFGAVYLGVAVALRVPEVRQATRFLKR